MKITSQKSKYLTRNPSHRRHTNLGSPSLLLLVLRVGGDQGGCATRDRESLLVNRLFLTIPSWEKGLEPGLDPLQCIASTAPPVNRRTGVAEDITFPRTAYAADKTIRKEK